MNSKLGNLGGDKRGILGGFLSMFIATIVVVIILLIFIFISGMVRSFSNNQAGIAIKKVGVENPDYLSYDYLNSYDYTSLVWIKFYLSQGKSLDEAIQEGKYHG